MATFDNPWDKIFDLLGRPKDWPHEHWLRCPSCGELGMIERDQYEGKAPIACSCGWIGYRLSAYVDLLDR